MGVEKAAILLTTLGPEAAAAVFRHLAESEVRQVSAAIARLRTIPREQAARVHEEAWRWLTEREGLLFRWMSFLQQWPLVIFPTLADLPPKQVGDTTVEGQAEIRAQRSDAARDASVDAPSGGDRDAVPHSGHTVQ